MSLRIRRALPGDAEALAALASAVACEPEGWLLAETAWRSAGEERRYIRAVSRHPHAALLLAELDGLIVGRLSLMRDRHPASGHVADVGVMVAAAARRRGVGSALLRAAEHWAQEASVSKLELHVFPHNLAAIALYEKLGYQREGYRSHHFRRPGGEPLDAILMAKQLP